MINEIHHQSHEMQRKHYRLEHIRPMKNLDSNITAVVDHTFLYSEGPGAVKASCGPQSGKLWMDIGFYLRTVYSWC